MWIKLFSLLLLSLFFSLQSLFAQDKHFTRYDTLRGSLNKFRSSFDVSFYHLHLRINEEQKFISGSNQISFNAIHEIDTIQIDLFSNLFIDSIVSNNQRLSFSRDSNHVFIYLKSKLAANQQYRITIFYHGYPLRASNPPWNGGFVWEKDSLGRPWFSVACEGLGASSWWPMKDHLSDEPDSMKISLEVPGGLMSISNGTLMEVKEMSGGYKKYTWLVHYPINSYNVTFYSGHYRHFSDTINIPAQFPLPLDYYVLDYHYQNARKHFGQIKKILACFSKYFGPYPFYQDGYGLVESSYWGMEHQGAIAYGNHYKNDLYDFDFIIVHETAHEWWGNSLSVGDHGDMWIHEAFATYAESILIEETYGYSQALKYLAFQRKRIMNQEPMSGPLNVNYNGWKDTDIYYKGAWMLQSIRYAMNNDSLWFAWIHKVAMDFRMHIVNTAMITDHFNRFFKSDFTSLFKGYLQCTQPPVLEYEYDKKKQLMQFRWESCAAGFNLPLTLTAGNDTLRIHPQTTWSSTKMKDDFFKKLQFPSDKAYFILRKK